MKMKRSVSLLRKEWSFIRKNFNHSHNRLIYANLTEIGKEVTCVGKKTLKIVNHINYFGFVPPPRSFRKGLTVHLNNYYIYPSILSSKLTRGSRKEEF